ncbi:DUF3800 domain-containing protein [Synechococcus sp. CS-1324]|uniref:DUF3800 domain-containing protein n=1 Tax=Synechococcus sp. CS-1324 TaxID=2847980 RepID=UPI000DB34BCA|nr:DUF3800 domain-containing protein [Synechococcus sp. CS-1324]MCT0230964.1 DUF3800 domain-containing protein [Synechococcus sp. CS-1324]PZV04181.1 MAG: hypothetical protein DCF23_07085 [Cyanobium sp.]
MTQFILYIDDSGTKEYTSTGQEYSLRGRGVSRYFVFGGILLSEVESGRLVEAIKTLKRGFFGTEDIEIKSNWLRNPDSCRNKYLNRYGKTAAQLEEFVKDMYCSIAERDLMIIAVAVDKVESKTQYGDRAWYPPAIAYELLMQRAVQEIRIPDSLAVVIDDMTGATPAGNQYKANLKSHHAQLRKTGSRLQSKLRFDSINNDLRFVDSAHWNQIQVADIIAYNVYRQFVEYGEEWEGKGLGDGDELPVYPWFEKLGSKFRSDSSGRVQGYGIIKFPMGIRVPWSFKEGESGATTS